MNNVENIVAMALVGLPGDRIPTEDEIRHFVDRLVTVFPVDDVAKTLILQRVMSQRLVHMDTGFALVEDHVAWVNARRPQIDPFYWNRLKLMLQKDWAPGVVLGLDRTTDEILDLLGNPEENGTWKRRGLVMGDVQSGKTATYSALICKAADAGYRFIVLLTGTIENLRRQTQERLDSGFVGFDSSELLKRNGRSLQVGVGLLDGRRQATVFTSSSADFRVATLDALGLSLSALREPALVVIKKNTKILENLSRWLRSYNSSGSGGQIDIPMLMIDDEADNASINTNAPSRDPTKVNAAIREILGLFRRTTYVGFTATPFANIFVDPDSTQAMLGDDLFPRDFIYALQAPTNYFGHRRIFLDDSGGALHLRPIADVEPHLAARHKSDQPVSTLPPSLTDALRAFLLANAIRDLRGEAKTHRSMLVNVSQFTRVQDQVAALVHAALDGFQTSIRNFSALDPATALIDDRMSALHEVWKREYAGCGFDWPSVQKALHNAALQVTVRAVNQRTGSRALDYNAHKDTGLRVIAVGGNSLSRGLTLEGLTISYFRRTTQMYDTLLQMGRWFGYRPGYEDLCRVWIPQAAIDWYGHISESTEELRSELKRMFGLGRRPQDFGLAVRAHPDSLLVTARNKMRTATEISRLISVSQQSFESVELLPKSLQSNFDAVSDFTRTLVARQSAPLATSGQVMLSGATRDEVAGLLRRFAVPDTEFRFRPKDIADHLVGVEGDVLLEWDVVIPTGDGDLVDLGGVSVKSQERKMRRDSGPDVLVVSGGKRRVGSRGVEKAGLTDEQKEAARQAAQQAAEDEAKAEGKKPPAKVNVADRFYRRVRTKPLLLLHVLKGEPEDANTTLPAEPLVAIGLSFPKLDNEPAATQVRYQINVVRARELFGDALEPGDDDSDEDES
jgi:hypothetical protein